MSDEQKQARCVAIDLGAGSGRLIEGVVKDGKLALTEVGRFQSPMVKDEATGYVTWDTDQIIARVDEGLAACAAKGPVTSVGADSWGVDYVLLDADEKKVGKAVCYRDDRTTGVMERVRREITDAEIYRRTGIQFMPFNTLYQLAASVEQEPEWMARAEHMLMIPDYVHFRLSGVISNEYTNATTTQMLGLDGLWDGVLQERIGLTKSLMKKPVDAATILGEVKLSSGVAKVIAPATHDTGSAVAGTPFEALDEAFISSGTWSLMGYESRIAVATPESLRMNVTNEGGVERRFRILKNIMGLWPLQRVTQEQPVSSIPELVKAAEKEEAWRSVVNLDDMCFMNPDSMTETLESYCRKTGQPVPETIAQLARCIFDSLALLYRRTKDELESLRGSKLARIRIIGGGCQNQLLDQLCADACQLPVSAGPIEASALGNLAAQLIALGEVADLDAARALIRASFPVVEYQPQASVPEKVWQRFEKLLTEKFEEEA